MDASIKLFRVLGIDIKMHLTFPLILIWAAVQFGLLLGQGVQGAIFGVIVTLLLFSIVLLHELGHSAAAQRYDIPVERITLLPIGGVAELGRLPENPGKELVIAIAGPAVNFALAIIFWLVAQALALPSVWIGPEVFSRGAQLLDFEPIFRYTFTANLFIGLFNLLPAFPLDGGRVLRALLAMRLSYARATGVAVTIGQTMAWLFGLWGVLQGNFFLLVLAVFVYMAASQEGRLIQVRSTLAGIQVRQAFARRALTLTPTEPLSRAVQLTFQSFQADFPVCDGERIVGLVTSADVMKALQQRQEMIPVAEVMRTDFPVATPYDYLFDVQQRMNEANVGAVPVVDNGSFVGMLTGRDIGEVYQLLSVSPHLLGHRSREM